jgi:hypothetical protein
MSFIRLYLTFPGASHAPRLIVNTIQPRVVARAALEAQASADAELGFDAGDAIIDINDFAGEGVELDV